MTWSDRIVRDPTVPNDLLGLSRRAVDRIRRSTIREFRIVQLIQNGWNSARLTPQTMNSSEIPNSSSLGNQTDFCGVRTCDGVDAP